MMRLELKSIHLTSILIILLFISTIFSGCLESEEAIHINGNIGKIQVTGDIDHIDVKDYLLETIYINTSSGSTNAISGIEYNENVIAYRIKGNISSIASEQLERVLIKFRFYGGISKGVFVLHSSTQETFYVDPGEEWSYNIRFERNNPKFTKINFFDIQIETEI